MYVHCVFKSLFFQITGYRYELPLYVLSEPSNLRGNTTTAGPSRRPSMIERLRRRI